MAFSLFSAISRKKCKMRETRSSISLEVAARGSPQPNSRYTKDFRVPQVALPTTGIQQYHASGSSQQALLGQSPIADTTGTTLSNQEDAILPPARSYAAHATRGILDIRGTRTALAYPQTTHASERSTLPDLMSEDRLSVSDGQLIMRVVDKNAIRLTIAVERWAKQRWVVTAEIYATSPQITVAEICGPTADVEAACEAYNTEVDSQERSAPAMASCYGPDGATTPPKFFVHPTWGRRGPENSTWIGCWPNRVARAMAAAGCHLIDKQVVIRKGTVWLGGNLMTSRVKAATIARGLGLDVSTEMDEETFVARLHPVVETDCCTQLERAVIRALRTTALSVSGGEALADDDIVVLTRQWLRDPDGAGTAVWLVSTTQGRKLRPRIIDTSVHGRTAKLTLEPTGTATDHQSRVACLATPPKAQRAARDAEPLGNHKNGDSTTDSTATAAQRTDINASAANRTRR